MLRRAIVVGLLTLCAACGGERLTSPALAASPAAPLFLLDGREIPGSAVEGIDPTSIETIEVLKGPAAAKLYGNRAGHGAIIITTKRAR